MKRQSVILILFFPILLFFVYSDLLLAQKLVNPDAKNIFDNIESFENLSQYFEGLLNLKTLDIQPIRDLTLYIDLKFFDFFRISTILIQNLIWWTLCCWMIFKIIYFKFSVKFKFSTLFLLVLAFSVYPTFFHVVSWGIARKHLLSFFFFLCALFYFLKEESKPKNQYLLATFYSLSILSQPITILLPFWFIFYDCLIGKIKFINSIKNHFFLFVLFTIVFIVNFIYYSRSSVFLYTYNPKTNGSLFIADQLLALGHYFFQVIFPYKFSFMYELSDSRVLWGLAIFSFSFIFFYFYKLISREMISWLALGAAILIVVLKTPDLLYDTYLLVPIFCLFILVVIILPKEKEVAIRYFSILVIFFWSVFSFSESYIWKSKLIFAKNSYNRVPSCVSALNFLRASYEEDIQPSLELKKYLLDYSCQMGINQTQAHSLRRIQLISNIFFYDDEFPLEKRIGELKKISSYFFIAKFNLAGLYIKNNRTNDADETIQNIINEIQSSKTQVKEFHKITSIYIYPYCIKKNWRECLDVVSVMSKKIDRPYL